MKLLFQLLVLLLDQAGQTRRKEETHMEVPVDLFWHEALQAYHKSDMHIYAMPREHAIIERRRFLERFMMEKIHEVMRPGLQTVIAELITADDTRNGYTKQQDAEFFSGRNRPSEGYHKHHAPRSGH